MPKVRLAASISENKALLKISLMLSFAVSKAFPPLFFGNFCKMISISKNLSAFKSMAKFLILNIFLFFSLFLSEQG